MADNGQGLENVRALELRLLRVVESILLLKGYTATHLLHRFAGVGREVDILALGPAPDRQAQTAVELKMYRSEVAETPLFDRAMHHLSETMSRAGVASGLMVVTSGLSTAQRESYGKRFPHIQVWDVFDLIKQAEIDPRILSELDGVLREMQPSISVKVSIALAMAVASFFPPPPGNGEALAARLESSSKGKSNKAAVKFEALCEEALRMLFEKNLAAWQKQPLVEQGFHRMDLIARIAPSVDFWQTLSHDFRTRYVVFEFKNYASALTQNEIYTTEKYLYTTALRAVAIIIARNGASAGAVRAMNGALREQGKLIICVTLAELCELLRGYDKGDDPSNLLLEKLDRMLVSIGR